jgi:hypothetical protein
MSLERVRRWVESMPATARKLPLIHHAGRYWTPEEILEEVSRCPTCPLAMELQRMLEMRALGQNTDITALAKERLLRLLEMQPVQIITMALGMPAVLSAEQLRREIETEGRSDLALINIEKRRIVELISRF